jgi:phosphoglycolate phosphatase-like HAD superfamily hydrolase
VRDLRGALGRGRPQRRVPRSGQPVVGAPAPAAVLTAGFATVVFDLDGTLLDSDAALAAPYVALGVPADEVTYGHVVADECRRLGLSVADYLNAYDVAAAQPYPGVAEVVAQLDRWAVCSNKARRCAEAELSRLGWAPAVARFAEDFGGGPKRLGPVLAALGVDDPWSVRFVGDTAHDRVCAADAGVAFAVAAWNPRAAGLAVPGDLVLRRPAELLDLVRSD